MEFPRVLFILKFRDVYGSYGSHISSGLLNSATFVKDMLVAAGVDARLVQVTDNNDIDREVTNFRPNLVVLEALWVVPVKFEVLQRLHPEVEWVIRTHSELPFLAAEGIAMEWLLRYVKLENVIVAPNSPKLTKDLRAIVKAANPTWPSIRINRKVVTLQNFYPTGSPYSAQIFNDAFLYVACFGAVRPLKNQLSQAVAAIRYAESVHKTLRFFVNGSRAEQGGEANLKNLRALFDGMPEHALMELPWMEHKDFLETLANMDLSLQVSLSETFNIVTADAVAVGLPVVVSPEIAWTSSYVQADPHDTDDIVRKIEMALNWKYRNPLRALNLRGLKAYAKEAKTQWLNFLAA